MIKYYTTTVNTVILEVDGVCWSLNERRDVSTAYAVGIFQYFFESGELLANTRQGVTEIIKCSFEEASRIAKEKGEVTEANRPIIEEIIIEGKLISDEYYNMHPIFRRQ